MEDVNRILLDILIVLVAAKAAAEIADRLHIPAVVGEITAGIIIGPSMLGWVHSSQALMTLAELGVILLLLEVGLEMDLAELGSVGRAALLVAIVGVTFPLLGGVGAGLALGLTGKEALFVGAALTATSVGITARVFGDLRALATVEARTVLGAAVADDILGLVILTVVTRIVTQGSVSPLGIAWVIVVAVGFVVLATLIGVRIVPPAFAFLRRYSRSAGTLIVLALAFTLAVSELAHAAQLAPIVGAFVAGIALARSSVAPRVRQELGPITHLLVPVFFLQIGIDVEVEQFVKPAVFGMAAVLLVVAILGKLASVLGMRGSPGDRWLVGLGMIPRGEVGLIFATLGLNQGIFGQKEYAALIMVVLITTVATPPALRARLLRLRARRKSTTSAGVATGGVDLVRIGASGEVELEADPIPTDALVVALRAALLCRDHAPHTTLLAWLEEFPPGPRFWDDASRTEFFNLLANGRSRSWRLLTASGVLQRCLPELDDALNNRRSDPFDLDPLVSLELPLLSALHDQPAKAVPVSDPRPLLLAALVLDACGTGAENAVTAVGVARRSAQRLDLGEHIERSVANLVNDVELLSAASRRIDGLSQEAVLQLAVHLGNLDQARALLTLTRALGFESDTDHDRLDALHALLVDAFSHRELIGREPAQEVERRRTEAGALTASKAVRDRIDTAARAFVLTQEPADLARQAELCEPAPGRDELRVGLTFTDEENRVEVAARDRVGLIAAMSLVLFEAGCSIEQAFATTWPDNTALASYRIVPRPAPDADELRRALAAALADPPITETVEDVELIFDDASSPWYTRVIASALDRPGLLHTFTAAFAAADLSVHSARVTTDGQRVVDYFDLTDKRGDKLDQRAKDRLAKILREGTPEKRRIFGWRSKTKPLVKPLTRKV